MPNFEASVVLLICISHIALKRQCIGGKCAQLYAVYSNIVKSVEIADKPQIIERAIFERMLNVVSLVPLGVKLFYVHIPKEDKRMMYM